MTQSVNIEGMLLAWFSRMKSRRQTHEDVIQEIQDFTNPYRGNITTKTHPGTARLSGVVDPKGIIVLDRVVGTLKSLAMPSNADWFRLGLDAKLQEFEDDQHIRVLMDRATRKIYDAFQDSDLYVHAYPWTKDWFSIGNGTLLHEAGTPLIMDEGDPMNSFTGFDFQAINFGRTWWHHGKGSKIILVAVEYEMPAISALDAFPEDPAIRARADKEPMGDVKFLHFVYRTDKRLMGGLEPDLPNGKKWASQWLYLENNAVVRTAGFSYNPYIVSRHTLVDGEEFARGRGHIARAAVLGSNETLRQIMNAAGDDMNPILLQEFEKQVQRLRGNRRVGIVKPGLSGDTPRYLPSGADYGAAQAILDLAHRMIEDAFMLDIAREEETQSRSAAETAARLQRRLQSLAPAADLYAQGLKQLVENSILIQSERGGLPELEEVEDLIRSRTGFESVDFKPLFISPFFTAQKSAVAERNRIAVRDLAEISQLLQDPRPLDSVDIDQFALSYIRNSDADPSIFKDLEQIRDIKEARAEEGAIQETLAFAREQAQTQPQEVPAA